MELPAHKQVTLNQLPYYRKLSGREKFWAQTRHIAENVILAATLGAGGGI